MFGIAVIVIGVYIALKIMGWSATDPEEEVERERWGQLQFPQLLDRVAWLGFVLLLLFLVVNMVAEVLSPLP